MVQFQKLEARANDPTLESVRFLYEEFKPSCFMFMVYEVSRRIFLTGCLSMFMPDSISQIAIGLLGSLISYAVSMSAMEVEQEAGAERQAGHGTRAMDYGGPDFRMAVTPLAQKLGESVEGLAALASALAEANLGTVAAELGATLANSLAEATHVVRHDSDVDDAPDDGAEYLKTLVVPRVRLRGRLPARRTQEEEVAEPAAKAARKSGSGSKKKRKRDGDGRRKFKPRPLPGAPALPPSQRPDRTYEVVKAVIDVVDTEDGGVTVNLSHRVTDVEMACCPEWFCGDAAKTPARYLETRNWMISQYATKPQQPHGDGVRQREASRGRAAPLRVPRRLGPRQRRRAAVRAPRGKAPALAPRFFTADAPGGAVAAAPTAAPPAVRDRGGDFAAAAADLSAAGEPVDAAECATRFVQAEAAEERVAGPAVARPARVADDAAGLEAEGVGDPHQVDGLLGLGAAAVVLGADVELRPGPGLPRDGGEGKKIGHGGDHHLFLERY
ncbi:hypothetical protein JL722_427 [Aureococcus anophagefferens]|nr:hypothetical protein JL722_427 [Aureococcus anophagefferens]